MVRHRSRSRSPGHEHKRQRKDEHRRTEPNIALPYKARPLTKHDLTAYSNLFAEYLDIQKEIAIDDLDERERKGRWKSFINKWNRGELSEGYYDPEMKARADARQPTPTDRRHTGEAAIKDDHDDDGYGPTLPQSGVKSATRPNRQDLDYRDELADDARRDAALDSRHERKLERKLQKDRLDELAPRAEPGTKERQMEKKREKADANRSFREARSPGAEEVGERDLMGGDDEDFKVKLKADEKRKTEREIRKEEMLRARAEEREERLLQHRAKEEKTMEMLRAIAQQRFG